MVMASVTVQLSEQLLKSVKQRAAKRRQPLNREVVELLQSGLAQLDWWEIDIDEMLQPLDVMSDADLWQAAESRLSAKLGLRLESLHSKRQRDGLTKDEREEARRLTEQYERGLLIRAHAAALLKTRGHDVSRLLTK